MPDEAALAPLLPLPLVIVTPPAQLHDTPGGLSTATCTQPKTHT